MTIAIIGSGKMGSGFARLLVSKRFDIAIGHKNPEKAMAVAGKIGVGAKGGSVKEAVGQSDVIILAVSG
jgi:predicted dinucleotide-binding enzyme